MHLSLSSSFFKQKTEYLKVFSGICKRNLKVSKGCLFEAKGPLCKGNVSTSIFERLFLVETSSFSAHLLCNPKMCTYSNCEYNMKIYIYIFVPRGFATWTQLRNLCNIWGEQWAGSRKFSLCQALFLFFIFCCKFYEKLFAVWRKNKKVHNRHGKRIEASACFSCLFITQQMYENGNNWK